ncbi:MAG: radical SAM protein [Lachnospiraceae bacterium]|nr:radical SAM protein [Lachnospiraceae bacterium]
MKNCNLCPRNCNADRRNGQSGVCGVTGTGILAARAALHMWEEPCISGENGSGAVFFSGCPLRCIYCQNYHIAHAEVQKMITPERLADIFLELQEKNASNINLVTPTHYTPEIIWAVNRARERGLVLPIVYNCSGYEKVETLKNLEGIVDIYLTDFKYMDREIAARYSKAADYPEAAKAALAEMVRQIKEADFDRQGMMKRGVIVRHLLLPNHVKNAKSVVKYVYETYGDRVYLSLMNQYTPLVQVKDIPDLNRRVTEREYEKLVSYAISLGVTHGFIQEGKTAKESFIPEFNYEGLLP